MADTNEVIRLMISQLQYYGYNTAASVLSEAVSRSAAAHAPSNQLAEYIQMAKAGTSGSGGDMNEAEEQEQLMAELEGDYLVDVPENITECRPALKPSFETCFITAHKGPCRTASFSSCGRYVATGSQDNSLKVLDVEKMKARPTPHAQPHERPVIRTMYDHTGPVNDLAFHPNTRVLASVSDDKTMKLYDLQKVGVKRAFRTFHDEYPIKSVSFHPSGDFMVMGTLDKVVRMYDVKTTKLFCSPVSESEAHVGGIGCVRFNATGRYYVSGGSDGCVRVWDTVSGQCVRTIEKAHQGTPISTVQISRNGKYVLTTGLDDKPKLYEVSSGKVVREYLGSSMNRAPIGACFSWNEEYIISSDERNNGVVVWCARTGQYLCKMGGHTEVAVCLTSSPVENSFMSCSEDFRARFWHDSTSMNERMD